MTPITGQPIVTAARMRALEAAMPSLTELMEAAGRGVAEAVLRLGSRASTLILCGPGNNGGDGYVTARILREAGVEVRVAASAPPASDLAKAAAARWAGDVDDIATAQPAPILIDALFGTGLTRPLDILLADRLAELANLATLSIAIDLPSGLSSDTGAAPLIMHDATDITLALGALKPAHILYPAAEYCGAVRVIDIGLGLMDRPVCETADWTMERPSVPAPYSFSHKYSRGMIVVIGGEMPGAAALAAEAAAHAGAGYVLLFDDAETSGPPHALVRRKWKPEALREAIAGKSKGHIAIVVGPGLGRGEDARQKLETAIESGFPVVIDGDALHLLDDAVFSRFKEREPYYPVVLTPHEGEFKALFGEWSGNKIDAARDAARRSGAIVVFKGPDTVIGFPDGRTRVSVMTNHWLSTAGTGDVLAGTIATMLTVSIPMVSSAEAAVWMHIQAAQRLGGAFLADDLARALSEARKHL